MPSVKPIFQQPLAVRKDDHPMTCFCPYNQELASIAAMTVLSNRTTPKTQTAQAVGQTACSVFMEKTLLSKPLINACPIGGLNNIFILDYLLFIGHGICLFITGQNVDRFPTRIVDSNVVSLSHSRIELTRCKRVIISCCNHSVWEYFGYE